MLVLSYVWLIHLSHTLKLFWWISDICGCNSKCIYFFIFFIIRKLDQRNKRNYIMNQMKLQSLFLNIGWKLTHTITMISCFKEEEGPNLFYNVSKVPKALQNIDFWVVKDQVSKQSSSNNRGSWDFFEPNWFSAKPSKNI